MPAAPSLSFSDPRLDPGAWARRLGVSREAIDLYVAAETIDLHIESFVWTRLFGYDLSRRHGHGLLDARLYSQVDFPRALEAGMSGGVWSIATNPLRLRARRTAVFLRNLARLRAVVADHADLLQECTDHAGYLRARAAGKYAVWYGIQGGNALDSAPEDVARIPDNCVSRITLVHLSRSTLGSANSPLAGGAGGITDAGRDYIRRMNQRRILLDLSHISPQGFWEALEVHDRGQPAIVSHSGVRGVHDIWRNIDDRQIRAIAELGGVIGVVFHSLYLEGSLWGGRAEAIVEHMAHIIDQVGDDFVALGSDWDGLIVTPRDMKTILELPVLVQRMLDRGWSEGRIRKILGENHLRVMAQIRP